MPPEHRLTIYHGTIQTDVAAIRREGLRSLYGAPPFLTDDEDRAAGYALRAVCLDLDQRGKADCPAAARQMAVVTVRADVRQLVADPAHEGDYAAPEGVPAASITRVRLITSYDMVPPAREVREFALLTLTARSLENKFAPLRPYADGRRGILEDAQAVACTCAAGGHWGAQGAAGVLLQADDGAVLLAKRSVHVDAPGWSIPGGALRTGEAPLDAALREATEELGVELAAYLDGSSSLSANTCAGGWTYWTAEARAQRFDVAQCSLSWETSEVAWFASSEVDGLLDREELHVGFAAYWREREEPNLAHRCDREYRAAH